MPAKHHPSAGPRRPRVAPAILIAVAVVLAGSSPVAAGWGEILGPGAGQTVVAGELVAVSWSPPPAGVEELELLLSVDGGARFPIRLTPQLDPGVGRLLWRVPNLPALSARLRLRVGLHGREVEGPVGEPFEIRARPGSPLAAARYCGGEWWVGCAPPRSEPEPFRSMAARLTDAPGLRRVAAASPDAPVVEPPRCHAGRPCPARPSPRVAPGRPMSRQPRSFPLLT